MHRTFISTVLAAALAVTSISATAAQADVYNRYPQQRSHGGNEAAAAAIAGIAALFIIGKTIERNSGRSDTVIIQQSPAPRHINKPRHKSHQNHRPRHQAHAPRRHHVNGGRADHWHSHGNGVRHRHAHGPRHHN